MDEGTETESRAHLAAAEAWLSTADALLRGLNHALTNRVSSLGAVAMSARLRGLNAGDLDRVTAEATKLEQLLGTYRLLGPSRSAQAEPTQVSDVVADALALVAMHPTIHGIPCTVEGDPATSPVLVIPSTLTHAVVFMLCAAAARLDVAAAANALHLSYTGDTDRVTIAVETNTPVRDGQSADVPELPTVRWLVRGSAVTDSASRTAGGGVRLELHLPTLARARSRERGD